MLVIFTKRRTRAVSSLYLSPSNGTHNNVSSAGCCCWSLALVSYLSIRWWGSLDTGVWTLGIVCFLSGRLEAGFSETQPQRTRASRQRWPLATQPASPISGVINLVLFSTAWWPPLNKTSPAAPGLLCILVAEDLLSFVLASRVESNVTTWFIKHPKLDILSLIPRSLYLVRMVRKRNIVNIDLRYMNVR